MYVLSAFIQTFDTTPRSLPECVARSCAVQQVGESAKVPDVPLDYDTNS